ncbi:hypothetical protein [Bradyrhizobium shewense]|uniref:hypothetical protein n=1 Tax=Bradyrhizobium shewense TaxID=1761772 RepID=UPI000B826F91|nr:hypothetical protein [Bradyrhizobium shewense]
MLITFDVICDALRNSNMAASSTKVMPTTHPEFRRTTWRVLVEMQMLGPRAHHYQAHRLGLADDKASEAVGPS